MTNIKDLYCSIIRSKKKYYCFFDSSHEDLIYYISSFYSLLYYDSFMDYSMINAKCWSFYLHNSDICFYFELSNQMKSWKNST